MHNPAADALAAAATSGAVRTLSPAQLAALNKVGDLMVPGDGTLPSFSAAGCAAHADRMLAHMNAGDRDGVRLLLSVFRVLPRPLIRALLRLADRHAALPGPPGAALRMLNLGVKGVVMSLYYSGLDGEGAILRGIGWDARVTGPADPVDAPLPPQASTVLAAKAAAAPPTPTEAMARARAAQPALARTPVPDRLAYVRALRDVILRRREEIVERIQQDTGKSRGDALISEIFGVLDALVWLETHGAKALADHKEHTPLALTGKRSLTWYEPLGTILIISPWNYPFYQAIVPITAALAAGNTVVYKPSEHTPLTGLVEDLCAEAQLPPGWVQIVYGDGAAGAALVA